ncbi:hypothetical protein B0H21DRAFT_133036 [Amylocystis lapponica]|nr:hypothetical protein B0H21DRAFT_133036 [Amylocystis lapponica]
MPLHFKSLDFLIRCRKSGADPCYISKLPNDILVDQVFYHLEVVDVIHMRQVSKLYYYLTHHSSIWKRLLRWAEVPLPPLPPTSRYSLGQLNGMEAERILLRAVSIEQNWAMRSPRCIHHWKFNAYHNVHSMVILPGGQYAVASVSDGKARTNYSIVIFVMDYSCYGAVPLAKTPTTTKAFHLQAKYMTIKGSRGIVISYVRRDYKHASDRAAGIDISDYSADYEIDSEIPMKYECVSLHVSLEALEILGDLRFVPGSEEFLRHARAQPPPFRRLAIVRTSRRLGIPALDEIWGLPYLAIFKGSKIIIFKDLNGGAVSTMTCLDTDIADAVRALASDTVRIITHPFAAQQHHIMAIRLVPAQNCILVVRKVVGSRDYPVEMYHVVPSGDAPREVERDPIERTWVNDNGGTVTGVHISDHGIPPQEDDSILPTLFGADDEPRAPRSISVFFRTADPEFCIRVTFFPRSIYHELPPTPPNADADAEDDEDAEELPGPRAKYGSYTTYAYPLSHHSLMKMHRAPAGCAFRILPGSYRTVVFVVPKDERADAPHVWRMYRYFDPASRTRIEEQVTVEGEWTGPQTVVCGLEVPREVVTKRVAAAAWDETIGRLCLAFEDEQTVTVLDYARAPRYGE